MKIAIAVALAISLLPHPTKAGDVNCAGVGELAMNVMKGRQLGITMSDMMSSAELLPNLDEASVEFVQHIIILAYNKPQYFSDEVRDDAANRFRNEIEVICYEATK